MYRVIIALFVFNVAVALHLTFFVVVVLVDLAGEDSFNGVSHTQLLLVIALNVVSHGSFNVLNVTLRRHLRVMPLVEVVIDILADFRDALDFARVLAAKERGPRITLDNLREIGRIRTRRLDCRWQESCSIRALLWCLIDGG